MRGVVTSLCMGGGGGGRSISLYVGPIMYVCGVQFIIWWGPSHYMLGSISYVGVHLIICEGPPHYMWGSTSLYVGVHLIICEGPPHYMWGSTSLYVGVHLIICGGPPQGRGTSTSHVGVCGGRSASLCSMCVWGGPPHYYSWLSGTR